MAERGYSIGRVREALIEVMDLGGAWGANMHESKRAVIRIGENGPFYDLDSVRTSFQNGEFVLVLQATEQPWFP